MQAENPHSLTRTELQVLKWSSSRLNRHQRMGVWKSQLRPVEKQQGTSARRQDLRPSAELLIFADLQLELLVPSARDAADGLHVLFPDAADSITGFRCDVQQQAPGFRLCGDSAPIGCLRRDGAAGAGAGGPLRGGPAERLGAGARAPDPAGGSRRLHRRRPAAGHPPRCFPQNRCVNVGEGQGPMQHACRPALPCICAAQPVKERL